MEKVATNQGGGKAITEVIKAIIIAVIISLLAILLMAFLIKIFNIPTAYISIINQVIKGVSILVACLISFKTRSNGWLKGIITGILYILIAYVIFSLLDGNFKMGLSLLNDSALGAVSGMVSGIIAVLIRKDKYN